MIFTGWTVLLPNNIVIYRRIEQGVVISHLSFNVIHGITGAAAAGQMVIIQSKRRLIVLYILGHAKSIARNMHPQARICPGPSREALVKPVRILGGESFGRVNGITKKSPLLAVSIRLPCYGGYRIAQTIGVMFEAMNGQDKFIDVSHEFEASDLRSKILQEMIFGTVGEPDHEDLPYWFGTVTEYVLRFDQLYDLRKYITSRPVACIPETHLNWKILYRIFKL